MIVEIPYHKAPEVSYHVVRLESDGLLREFDCQDKRRLLNIPVPLTAAKNGYRIYYVPQSEHKTDWTPVLLADVPAIATTAQPIIVPKHFVSFWRWVVHRIFYK
jgi:hypothetical protein